jgi:DNA-directed RNA polymerase subunit RPC12/RpoP
VKLWIRLIRFRCPTCGQRLAVERGQVLRQEVVVCQDCNTRLRLVADGAQAQAPAEAPDGTEVKVVRLAAR